MKFSPLISPVVKFYQQNKNNSTFNLLFANFCIEMRENGLF